MYRLVPFAAASAILVAIAACTSNSINSTSTPSVPGARLYGSNGAVTVFQGPFSPSSVPVGSINLGSTPGSGTFGVAVDPTDSSGAVYVATGNGQILKFSRPNPNGAPPTVTVSGLSEPMEISFDSHGNLFVPDRATNTVSEIRHPITGSSVPTAVISSGLNEPVCVALDANDTLYVLSSHPQSLLAFAAPYTGAAVMTTNVPPLIFPSLGQTCAYDRAANELFLANAASNAGYTLPLTTNEAPGATILTPFACEGAIAFDSSGNAFISGEGAFDINFCQGPASIAIETPPFTGTATFTIRTPAVYSEFAFGP